MLSSNCPSCSMPISFKWHELNTRVFTLHTVKCSWCGKDLRLSKFWLALVVISLITVPFGFVGLYIAIKITKLVEANDI